jgi:hypothetical protein
MERLGERAGPQVQGRGRRPQGSQSAPSKARPAPGATTASRPLAISRSGWRVFTKLEGIPKLELEEDGVFTSPSRHVVTRRTRRPGSAGGSIPDVNVVSERRRRAVTGCSSRRNPETPPETAEDGSPAAALHRLAGSREAISGDALGPDGVQLRVGMALAGNPVVLRGGGLDAIEVHDVAARGRTTRYSSFLPSCARRNCERHTNRVP